MLSRSRQWLMPPIVPDDEYRTFSLRILHITLLLLIIIVAIFPLFTTSLLQLIFLPFAFLVLALSYYFLHTHRYGLSCGLFLGGLWSVITLASISVNGIRNASVSAYAIIIIYSAILFSDRAVLLTLALSLLSSFALALGEIQGVLPLQTTPLFLADRIFQLIALLGSSGLLLAAASRVLRGSIARSRLAEQTLLERNRALEKEILDRQKAEQALRESEQRFKALVAHSTDMISVLQKDGTIAFESQSARRILGYEPDGLLGKNGFDHIHPDDLPRVAATFADKVQQPGSTGSIEYRFRHANGSWVYLASQATNLLDDPIISGIVINSRDDTERKQVEEVLAKERILLRTVIDHLPDNIYVKDKDNRFVLNNAASLATLGMSRQEDVLGKTDRDFFPPELAEQWRVQEQAVMQSGQSVLDLEVFQPWRDDKRRWVSDSIIPLHNGGEEIIGILGVSRDITEHKQAEERLRASEDELRQLSDAAWEGLCITDQGRMILINRQIEEMFGYEHGELVGQSVSVMVAPESRELVSTRIRESYDKPYEHVCIRKDGSTFPVEVYGRVILHQGRQLRVTAIRDISMNKEAEAHRLQAERLRVELAKERELSDLKNRFVSMVSHEFRTPLTVIKVSSELMTIYSDRFSPERKLKFLKDIQTYVQYMVELLDDVLTIGKAQAGKIEFTPTKLDVAPFCRNIFEQMQLADGEAHTFIFVADPHPGHAYLDERSMHHILVNLLSNAVKYSPRGGEIRLDVRREADTIVIRISDQGIGIPQDDQARMFETFHRARNVSKIQGTGLGLAIVKANVERHRGTITFDSQEGIGTTFTVNLPISPESFGPENLIRSDDAT